MQQFTAIGNLTKDPELSQTKSGKSVCHFTIAVNRKYVGQSGERETDFFNCTAWGAQADSIAKYCHKGTLVSCEGRIRTGSYDAQDGTKRYTTEVVCETVNFLSPKGDSAPRNDYQNNYSAPDATMPLPESNPVDDNIDMNLDSTDLTEDPFKSFGEEITLTSDDLPF